MARSDLPEGFIERLKSLVGERNVRTGDEVRAMDPGWDPANLGAGVLARPGDTEDLAAVVRLCREAGVSIVTHGGLTGLVGGAISAEGQVILSTARLDAIERLDPVERTVVAGAGVTLQALQEAAAPHGLDVGIDLPSRGTATLGGMASTNAGGVMAFRNGVMRHRVLGLEAVLPDGTIFNDLTRVVKTSAGYDLKHLLVGAEGTLGAITRLALKLDPMPHARASALLSLPSVDAVLDTINIAIGMPGVDLRAAEAMWRPFLTLTSKALGWADPAIDLKAPVFLLLTIGGAEHGDLQNGLETLFEAVLDRHPDVGGLIAGSSLQEEEIWRLREDTDLVYRAFPAAPSFDISLPQSEIPAYLLRLEEDLAAIDPTLEPLIFGHLADGNLHIILNRPGSLDPDLRKRIEAAIYRDIASRGGSFSAEHGVGSKRIGALRATSDARKLDLMGQIKAVLDPSNLFNPGKLFAEPPSS
ncbi:FAD-binding oxidoreductase [Fulvimarina endophytica]|uniref:FAD-binding oxidoreductase n=1 Tax=Fulvimarina endophytica TaxID=2293836 RepID=A0A371WYZ3_9HYPH|nr:FAD-binding oxidoreductase [Fulvimarina endophytica]RFC62210.1 FAD-binding oxidoreductase [Fulvimarina endophytica]